MNLQSIASELGTWLNANAGALQAFAAVVALVLSIYVPYRLDAKARLRSDEEQRLQVHALILAIFPELAEVDANFRVLEEKWEGIRCTTLRGPEAIPTLKTFLLDVPPILDSSHKQLYLLGEREGKTLAQLLALAWQYNRLIGQLQQKLESSSQEIDMTKAFGVVAEHLKKIKPLLETAIGQLKPIHDKGLKIQSHQ